MKKTVCSCLISLALLLTACGSDYASADVAPPATWAGYTCQNLSFRFIAGFQSSSWDSVQEQTSEALALLNADSRLTLLGHYVSPAQDQNTRDYLTLGYYALREEVSGQELESIMEELNTLDTALTAEGTEVTLLQKARIRLYSGNTALTFAVKAVRDSVTYVAQIALVPSGSRLYQFIYYDFSTKEDNAVLEQFLTSLSLS